MAFKRPLSMCPCCGLTVEWHTDGLSGGGHKYRCGNCFNGIDEDQFAELGELQRELQKLDEQRDKLLHDYQVR